MSRFRLRTFVRLSGVFALAGALTACSSLLGGPKTEVRLYEPQLVLRTDPAWPTVDWQLSIGTPQSSSFLDTARIAVRPQPERLQVYKGAAWTDKAPELVQSTLLHAFEDSGRIAAVGRFGGGVRGDFALVSELRRFEADYRNGRPEATIELYARLIQLRGTGVVAARSFRQSVPAEDSEVEAVVSAFGSALSSLSNEVVGWSLAEGERAAKAAGAPKRSP